MLPSILPPSARQSSKRGSRRRPACKHRSRKGQKAAQEAEQAKQLDRLKAWGLKNGSEYARELINANFPGWVRRNQFGIGQNTIAELIDGIELVDVTELEDSQTSKAAEETKSRRLPS